MPTQIILRALRYDIWATEQLIAHLRQFDAKQLELTVPGTYGSIRKTLLHIVAADMRYLRRFTPLDLVVGEDHTPEATLDDLAAPLGTVKETVERLFSGEHIDPDHMFRDARRRNPSDPPLLIASWLLLTQFVHHGTDHRAQIGTILGAHGLPTADIDVWAYGRDHDGVKEERRD